MLYIEHLTKTFGEKKAVDDLSLHIAPGEIYGFIGHNGAGKTTTLKSVVGIQQFDSGRITIGGHSIQDDPIACKKMLAYIPDNPGAHPQVRGPLRADDRPGAARRGLFPRHEAEACPHFGVAARAKAHFDG